VDTPLYFFNAQVATDEILQLVTERPDVQVVVVDLGATGDLDVTATDLLGELVSELHLHDITLLLAQVKGLVRDRLRRTGLMGVLGEDHVHPSIAAAVGAIPGHLVSEGTPGQVADVGSSSGGAPT
jgi:MFS superfamily sulfate permease-like transporter